MKNHFSKFDVLYLSIGFIALSTLSVLYFTLASYPTWHFSSTGQIGDTIGGLTAPIFGLLNAILLYITLRRQDQQITRQDDQRNEDLFNTEIYKRIDFINVALSSLKITIDVDDSDKSIKGLSKLKGVYTGPETLLFASFMFNEEQPILRFYSVYLIEWAVFHKQIKKIIIEASMLIEKNYDSKLTLDQKILNYEYISFTISGVTSLYEAIEVYHTMWPQDAGLNKFLVEEFLSFKPRLDGLVLMNPSRVPS